MWSSFIEPDLERVFDEARAEFVLDHLRREAGTLVGDEIVESGRHAGRFVRALGRTAGGAGVAALVVPEDGVDDAALGNEIEALRSALGAPVHKLVYGITGRRDRPLEVELVPVGELL